MIRIFGLHFPDRTVRWTQPGLGSGTNCWSRSVDYEVRFRKKTEDFGDHTYFFMSKLFLDNWNARNFFQPKRHNYSAPPCIPHAVANTDEARQKPRMVICCEFAAMHEAATEAERLASGLQAGSRGGRAADIPPRLGDRVIHKEIRSLVKQIEMSMAVNR